MLQTEKTKTSLALFCKVVDNYGDIGICWRFARQLALEHEIKVTLWVDDLRSFQRVCPDIMVACEIQQIANVTVRHWRDQDGVFSRDDVDDIVIEFFGVDIPPNYIAAMAQCDPRPVWLNLEGLTAEEWVEGCHTLPSSHPRLPLTKYFFFPGFTSKTGGLLLERGLLERCAEFECDTDARAVFLASLGVTAEEMAAFTVSLFCYPQAPVADLFTAWQSAGTAITCLVPEGVASDAVQAFLGQAAMPSAVGTRGGLTVRVLPFVPQPDYDKLLWACDLNFVRGEDSFVRAQWAAKPFIWHIYPQDENLHHVKLNAFLQRYAAARPSLIGLSHGWNAVGGDAIDWPALWAELQADMSHLTRDAVDWQRQIVANGDLTSNLVRFAHGLAKSAPEMR